MNITIQKGGIIMENTNKEYKEILEQVALAALLAGGTVLIGYLKKKINEESLEISQLPTT